MNRGNKIEQPSIKDIESLQARKEFGEAVKAIQAQSVINGTDSISMEEIDAIISECRQETERKG
ncbi:MAG: hypothetical protein FWF81_14485 [Defluviitaleaceae bacterium]|nr:hypothetical protein [Defluviitaleaceae bacterium]